MVFQGRAVHVLVEAPIADKPIPQDPITGMVQRRNMALEH